MKKVRLIFVGIMLAVLCVGFTSCSDVSEDINPTLIESVDVDATDIDVKSEDPENDDDPDNGTTGTGG
ncbi:MAG: hypothetical protein HEP71_14170 [Roseivirga sp.]|nr:hypothetical protein [Roseivirga sp.]